MNAVISTYRELDIATNVAEASPKMLIELLFEGAVAKLQRARGCIVHNDIVGRSEALSKASEIIDGLRNALDLERGGDLANNLEELYTYMIRRLFRANADNDEAAVLEVISLITTVSEAWTALDDEVSSPAATSP